MPKFTSLPSADAALPDHTQLPETDGKHGQNFQEHPQAMLLTDCLRPILDLRHPDGQYAIGQDSGIYYQLTKNPLDGCKAPDWFYIPDVPPMLEGVVRRSYVMWQELIAPFLVIEFVSGDGTEERDKTPNTGKFWVYERAIRADYYAIYEVDPGQVELYRNAKRRFHRVRPNRRGRLAIEELGIELGIWEGGYLNLELPWLRAWDPQGLLIPTHDERADTERQRAEEERQRADAEYARAERLAAKLRALGIDPDSVE
jgi:Uma2 family endonuclease